MGNVFLVVAGAAIGVLLVEVGLRMFGFSAPNFYRSDFYTGATLRAGAEGWWKKEGGAYVKINSEGLRDREHAKAKPTHTFRIAVLGDSYAEAMQVPVEETFWAVLERELPSCRLLRGHQIEVINFGVAGYGTAQELLTLRHRVWDYSPDLVVLAFLSGNDVRNNLRSLEQDPMRPYFVYQEENLVLDDSFKQYFGWRFRQSVMRNGGYWLIDHLRVLQLFNEARYAIRGRVTQMNQNMLRSTITRAESKSEPQSAEAGLDKRAGGKPEPQSTEEGLDTMVYLEPTDPLWKEAWRVTEGLIVRMNNEVKEHGVGFLVVTLTNGDQVNPDLTQRAAHARGLGVPDLLYPERRVAALGKREGIDVLNLAQPMAEYAEKHNVSLHGFKNGGGHWNFEGHHLAGKLIAERICSNFSSLLPSQIAMSDCPVCDGSMLADHPKQSVLQLSSTGQWNEFGRVQ